MSWCCHSRDRVSSVYQIWSSPWASGVLVYTCVYTCVCVHKCVEQYQPSSNVLWQPYRGHPSWWTQVYPGNDRSHQTVWPCSLLSVNTWQPHMSGKAAWVNKDKKTFFLQAYTSVLNTSRWSLYHHIHKFVSVRICSKPVFPKLFLQGPIFLNLTTLQVIHDISAITVYLKKKLHRLPPPFTSVWLQSCLGSFSQSLVTLNHQDCMLASKNFFFFLQLQLC